MEEIITYHRVRHLSIDRKRTETTYIGNIRRIEQGRAPLLYGVEVDNYGERVGRMTGIFERMVKEVTVMKRAPKIGFSLFASSEKDVYTKKNALKNCMHQWKTTEWTGEKLRQICIKCRKLKIIGRELTRYLGTKNNSASERKTSRKDFRLWLQSSRDDLIGSRMQQQKERKEFVKGV